MSAIAVALKHMLAAGMPHDAIVAAIADMEACVAPQRSKGAIRQARYMERQKASLNDDNDVSDANDATDEPDKNIPQTPYKNSTTPITPKGVTAPKGAKRNRGSRIDPDWSPPATAELPPEARALAEQWTKPSYQTEAAAFVAYWLGESGAKASKADWGRAWQNRIVQIHSKVMRDQKFGNSAPEPAKPVKLDAASLDRKAALFRRMGQDEDAADCERRASRLRQGGGPALIGSIVQSLSP